MYLNPRGTTAQKRDLGSLCSSAGLFLSCVKCTHYGTSIPGPKLRLYHLELWDKGRLCDCGQSRHRLSPVVLSCEAGMITLHSSSTGRAGQGRRLTAAPGLGPAGERPAARKPSVLSFPLSAEVSVNGRRPAVRCDLFLTVSRFVPVLLSSFCYSGFQKIFQLPKLVEWATFKISQVIWSIALQSGFSNFPSQNYPLRECSDKRGGLNKIHILRTPLTIHTQENSWHRNFFPS